MSTDPDTKGAARPAPASLSDTVGRSTAEGPGRTVGDLQARLRDEEEAPKSGVLLSPASPLNPVTRRGRPKVERLRNHGGGLDLQTKRAITKANRSRRRIALGSLALFSLLPTLLVGFYLLFFAADQYASRASFAIRGSEAVISTDLVGMMMGSSNSASNAADSYIIEEFIYSRSMVERLDAAIGLRERYDSPAADWWWRFPADRPIEDFLAYWPRMVSVAFDSYTGIISLEVKAFTPEDAALIAGGIVDESERLINTLSERARQDTVAFAEREVQFAEERLRETRAAVAAFRNRESTLDPSTNAQANERLIADLNEKLVNAQAELSQAEAVMGPEAPTVRFHKTRIAAIEAQIAGRRGLITAGADTGAVIDGTSFSSQITDYEALTTEVTFAEKSYMSSLASLEQARMEAKQKRRYLATFVEPTRATVSEFPQRSLTTLLVFVGSIVAWGILMLFGAAIRDHVA